MGVPGGGWAPVASRYRAASSTAIQRASPPIRTTTARRVAASVSSHSPAAGAPAAGPRGDLVGVEVAEAAQEVGDLVHGAGPALVDERLALELGLLERRRVEQLAQLLLAEQLAEQVAVERQRLCPPLGERGVALVHEGGDVVEEERRGERRRPRRLHPVDGDLAALHAAQHVAQGRQVEDVGQALAVRLDEDREAAVAAGDGEQVGGPLALLPERGPRARPAARAGAAPGPRSPGSGTAKRAVPPTAATTRSSTPSASGKRSSSTPSRSPSGRRIAIPSSDQMLDTSAPRRSRRRASIAIAHGAWTRPPNGVRRTSRQSPSSSRNRSTTIRRSVGRAPAASRSSSR